VLADQAEARLVLGRGRIFHPEHAELFNALAEARRLNGRQAMVHVVQQVLVKAKLAAYRVKQLRREVEVLLR